MSGNGVHAMVTEATRGNCNPLQKCRVETRSSSSRFSQATSNCHAATSLVDGGRRMVAV